MKQLIPLPDRRDDSILLAGKTKEKKEYKINGLVLRDGLNIIQDDETGLRQYVEIFGNTTYITVESVDTRVFTHNGEIHPIRKEIRTKDLKFYL